MERYSALSARSRHRHRRAGRRSAPPGRRTPSDKRRGHPAAGHPAGGPARAALPCPPRAGAPAPAAALPALRSTHADLRPHPRNGDHQPDRRLLQRRWLGRRHGRGPPPRRAGDRGRGNHRGRGGGVRPRRCAHPRRAGRDRPGRARDRTDRRGAGRHRIRGHVEAGPRGSGGAGGGHAAQRHRRAQAGDRHGGGGGAPRPAASAQPHLDAP